MRRATAALAVAALIACTSPASPTPDSQAARAGSQAATAVALSKPPPVATALAAPPAAAPSVGPKAVPVEGRVVFVRESSLALTDRGETRVIFKAPASGQVKDPTWSPDGQTIAFAYAPPRPTPRAGAPIVEQLLSSDIMLVDVDGQNLRVAASHDGPGQILETPSWSGDGKAVYFSFYAPTYKGEELVSETLEVRRREIGASTSATIVAGASNPAASRDGKWLAFIGEDPSQGQSLKVMPAAGGDARTLITSDRFAALLSPRFSPDGQTIAFSAASIPTSPGAPQPKASTPLDFLRQLVSPASAYAHGLPWEIWAVPTAGGDPRQLTQIQEDTPYAAWSADGARILVYGAGGLHRVEVRGAQTQTLSSDGSHGGMDWRSAS
jgi:Tol biopolymer transport system component